jgi:hypothetical protein
MQAKEWTRTSGRCNPRGARGHEATKQAWVRWRRTEPG